MSGRRDGGSVSEGASDTLHPRPLTPAGKGPVERGATGWDGRPGVDEV